MTIKLIKSPSYVAGQGLKLTGTGPGMSAGNVMSGGGGGTPLYSGSGTSADPYIVTLSSSIFTYDIDNSQTSLIQPNWYVRFFKVTVPANSRVTIDIGANADPSFSPLIIYWQSSTVPPQNTWPAGYDNLPRGMVDGLDVIVRTTLYNSTGSPVDYIFETANQYPANNVSIRVRDLAALGALSGYQIYGGLLLSFAPNAGLTQTVLTDWASIGPAVIPASSEWTSGAGYDYLLYVNYTGGAADATNYFRASIDSGANWTASSYNADLVAGNANGWKVDLRELVKPGGGTITSDDVGSNFTLSVESSADGSTWSQISSMTLSIIAAS